MNDLILLIIEFFKTGLFSIGGGLATLPFLYEMSDNRGWYSHADIADMIAISESTPGAIGVNMATYAGYKVSGIPGGIAATLSLVAPSVICIIIIYGLLQKFRDNKYVEYALYGLRAASLAMIVAAGLNVANTVFLNPECDGYCDISNVFLITPIIFAVILFVGVRKIKLHPVFFIALSAVVGIALKM